MIDLNIATSQEVFDYVIEHLRKQGNRSYDSLTGVCLYRSNYTNAIIIGAKCAVGCLIPDDVYSPAMENTSIREILRGDGAIKENLERLGFSIHLDLLYSLQGLHDHEENWLSPQDFDEAAWGYADQYGLTLQPRPALCS